MLIPLSRECLLYKCGCFYYSDYSDKDSMDKCPEHGEQIDMNFESLIEFIRFSTGLEVHPLIRKVIEDRIDSECYPDDRDQT